VAWSCVAVAGMAQRLHIFTHRWQKITLLGAGHRNISWKLFGAARALPNDVWWSIRTEYKMMSGTKCQIVLRLKGNFKIVGPQCGTFMSLFWHLRFGVGS